MSERTVLLHQPQSYSFFRQHPFVGFIPDIRCVTRIQARQGAGFDGGKGYWFKVYFANQVDFAFGFHDEKVAVAARRDLVVQMMACFGSDQVVFSKGFYSDLTVVPAIQDLTDIYEKDQVAGFTAIIAGVPIALHFISPDFGLTRRYHQLVCCKVEAHRQRIAASMERVAAAG